MIIQSQSWEDTDKDEKGGLQRLSKLFITIMDLERFCGFFLRDPFRLEATNEKVAAIRILHKTYIILDLFLLFI